MVRTIEDERQPLLDSNSAPGPPQAADAAVSDSKDEPPEGTRATLVQQAILIPCFTLLVLMVITNAVCVIPLQGPIATTYNAYDHVPWIVVIHSIAQSCALPLMGRLSRIFGSRKCLFLSSLIFTGGMAIIVLSERLSGFLLGRALSGAGAGGCLTTGMVMILEVVPQNKRALFLGILNAGYTLGFATGAALGGYFVRQWKMAFVTQMPMILVPGFLVLLVGRSLDVVQADKSMSEQLRRVDYLGVVTLSSASTLLLYTFNLSSFDLRFVLGSVTMFILFGWVEGKVAQEPIIPVTFLVKPHIIFSCVGILANVISWWCVLFYFPVQVIAIWGQVPSSTGAYLAPATGAFAVGGILVGKFGTKPDTSYYWHNLVSVSVFTLTLLALFLLPNSSKSAQWPFILTESISGFACAAVVSYSLSELLNNVHKEDQPIVASLFASFRGQAGSIGGALGSSTILKTVEHKALQLFTEHDHGHLSAEHAELARRIKGSPTLVWQLHGWEQELAVEAWRAGMEVVWIIGVVSGLVSMSLFVATRLRVEGHHSRRRSSVAQHGAAE